MKDHLASSKFRLKCRRSPGFRRGEALNLSWHHWKGVMVQLFDRNMFTVTRMSVHGTQTSGYRQNPHVRGQRRKFNFSAAQKRSRKTAAIDQDRRTITDHQCVDSFTPSIQIRAAQKHSLIQQSKLVTRGVSYGCDSSRFEIITSCFAPHSSRLRLFCC